MQIVDRPTQGHIFLAREYVQPQWVFDCVNARIFLPTEAYLVGRYISLHAKVVLYCWSNYDMYKWTLLLTWWHGFYSLYCCQSSFPVFPCIHLIHCTIINSMVLKVKTSFWWYVDTMGPTYEYLLSLSGLSAAIYPWSNRTMDSGGRGG